MAKSAYVRVLSAGLILAAFAVASACGGDDGDDEGSDGSAGTSGGGSSAGGTGGAAASIECGANTCEPLILPFPGAEPVAACCAEDDACGVDASVLEAFGTVFEEQCQARDQPGELDTSCPDSEAVEVQEAGVTLPPFKGCCREETGKCGYMLDELLGSVQLGLGCVDSEPFNDGAAAPDCGGGAGSGGAGGEGSGSGGAGAAGAGEGGASAAGASQGGAGGA